MKQNVRLHNTVTLIQDSLNIKTKNKPVKMRNLKFAQLMLLLMLVFCSCSQKSNSEQGTGGHDNDLDSNSLIHPSEFNTTESSQLSSDSSSIDIYDEFNNEYWGEGFFTRLSGNYSEQLNFVDTIKAYNSPDGDPIGLIIRNTNNDGYYNVFLQIDHKAFAIKRDDVVEINYEGTCVKYYKNVNDFYLCLINNDIGGVWIKKYDLINNGFKPIDWSHFIPTVKSRFHALHKTMVPLYDSNGVIIDTLYSTGKEVKLTGEKCGDLYKVDIHNPDDCAGGDGQKVGEAWVKIVDSIGKPIIFYYTRGC